MNSLQDSYLKALNPVSIIKVSNLDNGKIPEKILTDIYKVVSYKYQTYIDTDAGVIYIGKKV